MRTFDGRLNPREDVQSSTESHPGNNFKTVFAVNDDAANLATHRVSGRRRNQMSKRKPSALSAEKGAYDEIQS
jgi:hypothetical protein